MESVITCSYTHVGMYPSQYKLHHYVRHLWFSIPHENWICLSSFI